MMKKILGPVITVWVVLAVGPMCHADVEERMLKLEDVFEVQGEDAEETFEDMVEAIEERFAVNLKAFRARQAEQVERGAAADEAGDKEENPHIKKAEKLVQELKQLEDHVKRFRAAP